MKELYLVCLKTDTCNEIIAFSENLVSKATARRIYKQFKNDSDVSGYFVTKRQDSKKRLTGIKEI